MKTPTPRASQRFVSRRTPLPIPAAMTELGPGSPVGEYEIQAQIGEGAMGTVFSAIHPVIGKTVAIKVLKPELCANQASVDRFVQEAQAVNRIGHPNIVDVFSLAELPDGRWYFVMEWLRGEDLKIRMGRGPLTLQDTCDVLDGIARALEAAHAKDIVHRDLKPDNVFLHRLDDGPITVKLLDFGIAKLTRANAGMERTQTGSMLGTPRYISPEQARGVDVTYKSDVYSLGVMAYELLAGRPPFVGETGMDLIVMHLNEPPPPLSEHVRVPKALELCVMRMLAKDPAQRPSLAEVRAILADPHQRVRRGMALPGRGRGLAFVIGGVVITVAAALVTWRLVAGSRGDALAGAAPAEPLVATVVQPPPAPVAPPSPPPQPVIAPEPDVEDGFIDITVKGVKDAEILVDGTQWARGQSTKVSTAPGTHTITVKPRTGEPVSEEVVVEAGQTAAVTITVAAPTVAKKPLRTVRRAVPKPKPKPGLTEDSLLKPKGVK